MRLDDLDGRAGDVEETEFATVRNNLGQRPHVIEDERERSACPDTLIGRDPIADVVVLAIGAGTVSVYGDVDAIYESRNADEAAAWSAPHFDDIHLR